MLGIEEEVWDTLLEYGVGISVISRVGSYLFGYIGCTDKVLKAVEHDEARGI